MWYLLENYATNADIKATVDNTELFFVPCVNPDGYVYNQTTNPNGGGMWRKNRRNNGTSFGVDINRNYGYNWGLIMQGHPQQAVAILIEDLQHLANLKHKLCGIFVTPDNLCLH